MERLVESIRVPCRYAAHGCALRPVYYDQESHRLVCEHAPCHCPGEACSFVGSKTAILDHFSTTHKWPCITVSLPDDKDEFTIGLHDGFNFLLGLV
jgi:E3 ubiquitin-protein ligase SIAH1